jgi:hypothetical protein
VLADIFIGALIVGIFLYHGLAFWWRQNEWKRRWKDRANEES